MININIYRNHDKEVYSFKVEGHAYADEPGRDIVCAAVSALSQTAVLSLYEIANIDITYQMEDGLLICNLPKDITEEQRYKANIVIESMLIGLKSIAEMYSDYIVIFDREV